MLAVSVCPQSLPYFAAKFSLSVTDASRRLCGFLKSLGEMSLMLLCIYNEFVSALSVSRVQFSKAQAREECHESHGCKETLPLPRGRRVSLTPVLCRRVLCYWMALREQQATLLARGHRGYLRGSHTGGAAPCCPGSRGPA